MNRRAYIDWLRGIAVVFMVSWHVIDSWTVLDGRDSTGFAAAIFIAGWAAPMFLFLAGVSLPLAGAARLRRGLDRTTVARGLQRRGWEVFALAHLFRFQSFLLNPDGSWNSLLKPDILNVLGLSLVVVALCWRFMREDSPRVAFIWLLLPALLMVLVLTPWIRQWSWPSLLYPRFEAYLRPRGNFGVFSLFPAMAYVFAGAWAGTVLGQASNERTALSRLAVAGAGWLTLSLAWSAAQPWIAPVARGWFDPSAVVFLRWGAILLSLAIAGRLVAGISGAARSLVLLGRTSFFVYWVHVELAYGGLSSVLHHALPLGQSVVAFVAFLGVMFFLARWWAARPSAPLIPAHLKAHV